MKKLALLSVPAFLAIAGCGGSSTPAAQSVKTGGKADAQEAPKLSESMAEVPYSYDPVGKRDPFRSPVEDMKQVQNENSPCSEPLCQWDLDQLTLVAIVTGD